MNVWILEDEPDHAAALLEKMKAYPGSRAFAARVFSSPQALREARQAGQETDLLLTDLRLGEEVLMGLVAAVVHDYNMLEIAVRESLYHGAELSIRVQRRQDDCQPVPAIRFRHFYLPPNINSSPSRPQGECRRSR